jgi:hypothetical protein
MCGEDVCDCIADDFACGCVVVPVGDLTPRDDEMVNRVHWTWEVNSSWFFAIRTASARRSRPYCEAAAPKDGGLCDEFLSLIETNPCPVYLPCNESPGGHFARNAFFEIYSIRGGCICATGGGLGLGSPAVQRLKRRMNAWPSNIPHKAPRIWTYGPARRMFLACVVSSPR